MPDSYQPYVPTPGVYQGNNLGASRWFASAGFGIPGTVEQGKPTREYVAGSPWGVLYKLPHALPGVIDDIGLEVGPEVYEAMIASDPVIASSVKFLKLATLSGGVQVSSCITPNPDGTENEPDHELAEEVAAYDLRVIKGLKRPFSQLLYEYLDALAFGAKLGEKIYEVPEVGPDANYTVLTDIRIKPRRSWRFVVDRYMAVLGILAASAEGSGSVTVSRDKFAVFTHDPKDSDPRGSSILRAANSAWNLKLLTSPQMHRFQHLAGSPIPIGTTAEHASPRPADVIDQAPWLAKGYPAPSEITAEMDMISMLELIQQGSCAAIPHSAGISYLEAKGDGAVFRENVCLYNREMATAILLQTRATQEAQHGSKADSESGTDVVGIYVEYIQGCVAEFVLREIFYTANVYRFGKDVADRLAPKVALGKPSQKILIAYMNAIANLESKGYLADSQRPTIDVEMGLPVRKPEEINRPKPDLAAVGPDGKPVVQPGQQDDETSGDKKESLK